MELCFATNNEHKLEEVKKSLARQIHLLTLQQIGCYEELPETTGTIKGNSQQKAEFVYSTYHVNCFADDSGLEVEALHGAPGVDSAFYAGPQKNHSDNVQLLLRNMQGISNRAARFITVITLVAGGKVFQFEGILNGRIVEVPRGENGFGYDPVFLPDGFSNTLAEMTLEEKNKISHRAKAIEKLTKFISGNPIVDG